MITIQLKDNPNGPPDALSLAVLIALSLDNASGAGEMLVPIAKVRAFVARTHRFAKHLDLSRSTYLINLIGWVHLRHADTVELSLSEP